MKKKYAKSGLTLNRIIEKMEELRNDVMKYHPSWMSISKSQHWASNQERHCLTMCFRVGGWLQNDTALTKEQWSTVNQGFEVVEINVWAYWDGNHYDMEPVEGTVYTALIVDRRGRWDAGSYDHLDFDGLKTTLNNLLTEKI